MEVSGLQFPLKCLHFYNRRFGVTYNNNVIFIVLPESTWNATKYVGCKNAKF